MILHTPFIITGRLLPGLKIGDSFLSADGTTFYLDTPKFEHVINDFSPGASQSMQEWFASILNFMYAAGEAKHYRVGSLMDTRVDSSETLFPPNVVDWIVDNLAEVEALSFDLGEGPQGLIQL